MINRHKKNYKIIWLIVKTLLEIANFVIFFREIVDFVRQVITTNKDFALNKINFYWMIMNYVYTNNKNFVLFALTNILWKIIYACPV